MGGGRSKSAGIRNRAGRRCTIAMLSPFLTQIVDDAVLVWVVHDTNPHALSPRIKKFVQAQHWFQDLTTIGVE